MSNSNSTIQVSKQGAKTKGTIILDGSKSLSNRVLIIQELCEQDFSIENLSTSDDTKTLQHILASGDSELDTGHAGTTYRFMTALLTLRNGTQVLTGSDRMKERPIKPLVDALRDIGADIKYLEKEGYPPLQIGTMDMDNYRPSVTIRGDMSSQYISALLMIAPRLPRGLQITIEGELVSRPYLQMTISLMGYFGVHVQWIDDNHLQVDPQPYVSKDITVESDWSAASYYYGVAALSVEADIVLMGLFQESLQGDQEIVTIANKFGVQTTYIDGGVHLHRAPDASVSKVFEQDFITCPDIAQTVAVMAGGLGVDAIFSGLQTLKIKETDRIVALQNELRKVGVSFILMPSKFSKSSQKEYYMVGGKATTGEAVPIFESYKDHRMAMAFACLSILFPIQIVDPAVVHKSYPSFWEDFKKLEFSVE